MGFRNTKTTTSNNAMLLFWDCSGIVLDSRKYNFYGKKTMCVDCSGIVLGCSWIPKNTACNTKHRFCDCSWIVLSLFWDCSGSQKSECFGTVLGFRKVMFLQSEAMFFACSGIVLG